MIIDIGRFRLDRDSRKRQTPRAKDFRTVVSTDEAKIILDNFRTGANLHLDQGIAVTSHASQAKTVDKVIASVRFGRSAANEVTILCLDVAREVGHACLLYGSKVALRDARHSTEQAAFLLGVLNRDYFSL